MQENAVKSSCHAENRAGWRSKTAKPGKFRGENFERFQAMKDDSILPTALQEKNIEAKINI